MQWVQHVEPHLNFNLQTVHQFAYLIHFFCKNKAELFSTFINSATVNDCHQCSKVLDHPLKKNSAPFVLLSLVRQAFGCENPDTPARQIPSFCDNSSTIFLGKNILELSLFPKYPSVGCRSSQPSFNKTVWFSEQKRFFYAKICGRTLNCASTFMWLDFNSTFVLELRLTSLF